MIIHCSQKLAAKLAGVSPAPLDETSPLGSWHGHLFTLDRRQCVLFCHDETRYTLFFSGLRKEHFADMEKWFRPLFMSTLAASGCTDSQIKKAELVIGPARFDTAINRSVQGSLRIAKQDLEAWVARVSNVMELDPVVMSRDLNQRPVTIHGKALWTEEAMLKMLRAVCDDPQKN